MAIRKKVARDVAAVLNTRLGNAKAVSLVVAMRKAVKGSKSFRKSIERIGKALVNRPKVAPKKKAA